MKKPLPKHPIPPEVQTRLDALEHLIDLKYDGKQAVFSKKTGVALSQIGQWYTGDRLLRENALETLEKKTGLPRGYFDGASNPEAQSPLLYAWPLELVSQDKYDQLTHAEKCRVQVHMADEIEEILKSRQASKKVA